MIATLVTLCGCQRTLKLEDDHRHLPKKLRINLCGHKVDGHLYRIFEYRETTYSWFGLPVGAVYMEKAQGERR